MSRLTIAVLLLLLAAAAVVLVILPQWGRLTKTRLAVQQLQALHEELNELAASRDALTQQYNAILQSDLEKLMAIAPRDRGTPSVLTDLEVLAQGNALFLNQVDFVGGEKAVAKSALSLPGARLYGTIPVSISLRGSYENFRQFLMALEHNLRLIDVDEITFATAQEKEFPVTLKGVIYYQK